MPSEEIELAAAAQSGVHLTSRVRRMESRVIGKPHRGQVGLIIRWSNTINLCYHNTEDDQPTGVSGSGVHVCLVSS